MSELARRASDVSTVAFSQLVDGPLVTAERVLERHGRARQCCCLWCACPLSKGVYWALGLLVAEAFVQLILFLARPPWAWRVTPFILVCYLLQVGTRMGLLAISAYAYYKLEQGRSVVFILRMQLRGLIWRVSCRSNPALRPQPRRDADLGSLSRRRLCLLELVVMIASLAEERLLCEAPLVEDMRNRHDPNVVDSEPLCELESDAYDLVRSILSVRWRAQLHTHTSGAVGAARRRRSGTPRASPRLRGASHQHHPPTRWASWATARGSSTRSPAG